MSKTSFGGKYYPRERMKKINEGMEKARGGMGADTTFAPYAGELPEERAAARKRKWLVECREPGASRDTEPFFKIELSPGEYKVGRDREICDIKTCTDTICPRDVSRIHAVLVLHATDGHVTVRDLNSQNGTFIQGKQIAGDEVLPAGVPFRVTGADVWVTELGVPKSEPKPAEKVVLAKTESATPRRGRKL